MWSEYISPSNVDEAVNALSEKGASARIVAGATDLILELERGVRTGVDTVIDISRIRDLDKISREPDGLIHIGPMVTHNDVVSSKILRENAFPLVQACWEVGAPQIRNRATVAGNLITASPANDTITPLMALDASVTLKSKRGERKVKLSDFYTGVRKTVMQPDEVMIDISFYGLKKQEHGTFIKVALRRAQAISVVNLCIIITLEENKIKNTVITLGAVAPKIIRATSAESYMNGKMISDEVIEAAARLTGDSAAPIDDIRATADFRKEMLRVHTRRGLKALWTGSEKLDFPDAPITLTGKANEIKPVKPELIRFSENSEIKTVINQKEYIFKKVSDKTLLRLLREDAGLIGTKEGCAEGECGACTVFLDGKAVMACMVPAPRAHLAEITTIEGLANGENLHPVQEAFIQAGAVQCGYCSPGFIMSAAKLLEEEPQPSKNQIEEAITGNLCRCTGYYKIVKAIEDASFIGG